MKLYCNIVRNNKHNVSKQDGNTFSFFNMHKTSLFCPPLYFFLPMKKENHDSFKYVVVLNYFLFKKKLMILCRNWLYPKSMKANILFLVLPHRHKYR